MVFLNHQIRNQLKHELIKYYIFYINQKIYITALTELAIFEYFCAKSTLV